MFSIKFNILAIIVISALLCNDTSCLRASETEIDEGWISGKTEEKIDKMKL